MKSKDFAVLVGKLEKEIMRNRKFITDMQCGEVKYNERMIEIAKDYIKYHEEIIRFIKRLDKELAKEKPSNGN